RGGTRTLDAAAYEALAVAGTMAAPMGYGRIEPRLFETILRKSVAAPAGAGAPRPAAAGSGSDRCSSAS
ncbi:MAG: hypothetical protein ABW032_07890, partial [Burkholderiaceae bacterium]